MAYALIDWSALQGEFAVRDVDGRTSYSPSADKIVDRALGISPNLRVNERMEPDKLIRIVAAAIFKGKTLCDMAGREMTGTPVPQATVRHITRKEMGAIIPDGWYVEVQLNRYSACFGEDIALPARKQLASAISDMHEFMALSIKQANDDLLQSVRAQRDLAEAEQLPMWASSDSPAGAVDASTELDAIA